MKTRAIVLTSLLLQACAVPLEIIDAEVASADD